MPANVETVLLLIDNSPTTLARLLQQIRLSGRAAIKKYVRLSAALDMERHGDRADRENGRLLRQALRGCLQSQWDTITTHYMTTHREANGQPTLTEYLTPELQRLG